MSISAASSAQTRGFLLLNSESNYRLSAQRTSNNQRVGDRIGFSAHGFEQGKEASVLSQGTAIGSLVQSASLRVTAPDGSITTAALFDDGLHGDGKAADGVFGGDFLATQAGEYNVQVIAQGQTPTGAPFLRTTEHLVPVLDGEIHLSSGFATSPLHV